MLKSYEQKQRISTIGPSRFPAEYQPIDICLYYPLPDTYEDWVTDNIGKMTSNASSDSSAPVLGLTVPYPWVRFDPDLWIQRQAEVRKGMLEVSKTFSVRSVLDVGCGSEGTFISSLLGCTEALPLEIITGIDIDNKLRTRGLENCFAEWNKGQPDSSRWRDIRISLLLGSFTGLDPKVIGKYDVITATEVFEHLTPGIVEQFAPIILGKMRPKAFILTTPNREFNRVFALSFASKQLNEKGEPYTIFDPCLHGDELKRRHYWPPQDPLPYPMRHNDHKFEMTRKEFEAWGKKAAQAFGYEVKFSGCGTLGDQCDFANYHHWQIDEAFEEEIIRYGNEYYLERDGLQSAFIRTFGYCTQVATFVRIDTFDDLLYVILPPSPAAIVPVLEKAGFEVLADKVFAASDDRHFSGSFPPNATQILTIAESAFRGCLPSRITDEWAQIEGSLGNCQKVIVHINADRIWEASWDLRRLCRFDKQAFLNVFKYFSPPRGKIISKILGIEIDNIVTADKLQFLGTPALADKDAQENIVLQLSRPAGTEEWQLCTAKFVEGEKVLSDYPAPLTPPSSADSSPSRRTAASAQPVTTTNVASIVTANPLFIHPHLRSAPPYTSHRRLSSSSTIRSVGFSDSDDDIWDRDFNHKRHKSFILEEKPSVLALDITWPLCQEEAEWMLYDSKSYVGKSYIDKGYNIAMSRQLIICDSINIFHIEKQKQTANEEEDEWIIECSYLQSRGFHLWMNTRKLGLQHNPKDSLRSDKLTSPSERQQFRFQGLGNYASSSSSSSASSSQNGDKPDVEQCRLGANVYQLDAHGFILDHEIGWNFECSEDSLPLLLEFVRPSPTENFKGCFEKQARYGYVAADDMWAAEVGKESEGEVGWSEEVKDAEDWGCIGEIADDWDTSGFEVEGSIFTDDREKVTAFEGPGLIDLSD